MRSQFNDSLVRQIEQSGIVAVLVIDDAAHAVPVARALLDGGITAIELTLRTPAAIDSLKRIRQDLPEMVTGIGTVLTPDQVRCVRDAGGQFAVAPGCNPRVIEAAQEVGLPFAPGIATPTDLEVALELGCREVKFFPSEPSGGIDYLKSLAAPYNHLGVRYLPLGGVRADNLAAYLAEPLVLAVGGSWLATREAINNKDWDGIAQRAAEAVTVARQVRS